MAAATRPYHVFEVIDVATLVEDLILARGVTHDQVDEMACGDLLDLLEGTEILCRVGDTTFVHQNTEGAQRAAGRSIEVDQLEDRTLVAVSARNFQPLVVEVGPGENTVSIRGRRQRDRERKQSAEAA